MGRMQLAACRMQGTLSSRRISCSGGKPMHHGALHACFSALLPVSFPLLQMLVNKVAKKLPGL